MGIYVGFNYDADEKVIKDMYKKDNDKDLIYVELDDECDAVERQDKDIIFSLSTESARELAYMLLETVAKIKG